MDFQFLVLDAQARVFPEGELIGNIHHLCHVRFPPLRAARVGGSSIGGLAIGLDVKFQGANAGGVASTDVGHVDDRLVKDDLVAVGEGPLEIRLGVPCRWT